MSNCKKLEPFVTPYVDGELDAVRRSEVDEHLGQCPPCYGRVAAESAIRCLIQARKAALERVCAPRELRGRCAHTRSEAVERPRATMKGPATTPKWRLLLRPVALAATLVLIVGGAFVHELTDRSSRVMCAELVADHLKCFGIINPVVGTNDRPEVVGGSIAGLGWHPRLPERAEQAGLSLLGARLCLYGKGRLAHIMYLHNGHPMSVFMLPKMAKPEEVLDVMGHQAAIWSIGDRTFVLITRGPRSEFDPTVSYVQAALR